MPMEHRAQKMSDTPIHRAVVNAISRLERDGDIALLVPQNQIVERIAATVDNTLFSSLSQDQHEAVVSVLREACYGPGKIEDWECHSLTGLTKQELEAVLLRLSGELTEP